MMTRAPDWDAKNQGEFACLCKEGIGGNKSDGIDFPCSHGELFTMKKDAMMNKDHSLGTKMKKDPSLGIRMKKDPSLELLERQHSAEQSPKELRSDDLGFMSSPLPLHQRSIINLEVMSSAYKSSIRYQVHHDAVHDADHPASKNASCAELNSMLQHLQAQIDTAH